KFRTMHVNASAAEHEKHLKHLLQSGAPMVKMDGLADKRLIKAGRLLRATGLDELPQLFNVLRGEMSIVGPRPSVSYEFEQFSASEKQRLNGLPGLTGLWQVSGKNKTTFQQMIQLDVQYLENASPFKDLTIMFKTVPTLGMQVVEPLLIKFKRKK
ncbi:MAG: sugar transferase, partial [Verrucomicrobiales bacterium]